MLVLVYGGMSSFRADTLSFSVQGRLRHRLYGFLMRFSSCCVWVASWND
jgi:hypothetical protein